PWRQAHIVDFDTPNIVPLRLGDVEPFSTRSESKVGGEAPLRYANELDDLVVRIDHVDALRIEARLVDEPFLVDLEAVGAIAAPEMRRDKAAQQNDVFFVYRATPLL